MKIDKCFLALGFTYMAISAFATTFYVDASRPNDSGDGLSNTAAKQSIQAAINLATDGDTVLVNDGTYTNGFYVNDWTNRIYASGDITIQSVNGPETTIIDGNQQMRGVFLDEGATLAGFTITGGTTSTNLNSQTAPHGGGIYANGGWQNICTVSNCIITGNSAARQGAGAYLENSLLRNSTIESNVTKTYGGGLYLEKTTAEYCFIRNNEAWIGGGCVLDGASTLNCSLIQGNNALGGGGVSFKDGTLNSCTIVENSGYGIANGIPNVSNSIIWYNTPGDIRDPGGTIQYSCSSSNVSHGYNNCITNEPNFRAGTWKLDYDSPCRGVGNVNGAPDFDLAGNPRKMGGDDMGAYEAGLSFYVDANRPDDTQGGRTWDTAKRTLQAAADVAHIWQAAGGSQNLPFVDIWVAPGTYNEGSATAPNNSRANRLLIHTNLHVYSTQGSDNTIIDGYNSMRAAYLSENSRLEGFTLTRGNATLYNNGGGAFLSTGAYMADCQISTNTSANYGGGIYLSSQATVTNCYLAYNTAEEEGGGVYLYSGGQISDVFIENCSAKMGGGIYARNNGQLEDIRIDSCMATGRGGGVYLREGSSLQTGTISYCRADSNGVGSFLISDGGGAYLYKSSMTGVTLSHNDAERSGGGAYLYENSTATNCTVDFNVAQQQGGGLYCSWSKATDRCTIQYNQAQQGGGVFLNQAQLYNSLIRNNTAHQSSGAGVYANSRASVHNCTIVSNQGSGLYLNATDNTTRNCIIWSNSDQDIQATEGNHTIICTCASSGVQHGDLGCLTINPRFAYPVTYENRYHLSSQSPCINAGYDATGSRLDLAGNPRVQDANMDLGAFETSYPDQTIDSDLDGLPDEWEVSYFDAIANCDRTTNHDGDRSSDFQEYLAGTSPTNAQSFFSCSFGINEYGRPAFIWEPHPEESRDYVIEWAPTLTNNFKTIACRQHPSYEPYLDSGNPYEMSSTNIYQQGFFRITPQLCGTPDVRDTYNSLARSQTNEN